MKTDGLESMMFTSCLYSKLHFPEQLKKIDPDQKQRFFSRQV